jgi:hemerythrin-like domain-containing protein
METKRHTCRILHEEHEAVFELLRRLQRALERTPLDTVPADGDPEWTALLRDVRNGLEGEVARHFEFEERSLFPLLVEAGEGDLVDLLNADHRAVREVSAPLLEGIVRFQAGRLDAAAWRALRAFGLSLCGELADHAGREEQSLLPALEDALSEAADRELVTAYAGAPAVADHP